MKSKFNPGIKMTVFVMVMLPVLASLGIWQLNRGAEKRALENDYLRQLTRLPQTPALTGPAGDFSRLRLQGQYQPQVFLVDNQVREGRPGYWVVQRFDDQHGQAFLVNRGYIAAPQSRGQLPGVDVPREKLAVVGMVWPYTGLVPVLDDDPWPDGWPKRVQRMDVARMAESAQTLPLEVRLEPGQTSVFAAAPFAAVLSDDIHLGYAATWFGLAAVLLAGYVVFGLKQAAAE